MLNSLTLEAFSRIYQNANQKFRRKIRTEDKYTEDKTGLCPDQKDVLFPIFGRAVTCGKSFRTRLILRTKSADCSRTEWDKLGFNISEKEQRQRIVNFSARPDGCF